jgi:hypothetical protein
MWRASFRSSRCPHFIDLLSQDANLFLEQLDAISQLYVSRRCWLGGRCQRQE